MIKSFDGTAAYYDEYFEANDDHVNLIQLVSGQLLIGFVFDGLYKTKTQITYVFHLTRNAENFTIHPWTPQLETPSVTIMDSAIIGTMRPSKEIIDYYRKAVKTQFVTIDALDGNDTVH